MLAGVVHLLETIFPSFFTSVVKVVFLLLALLRPVLTQVCPRLELQGEHQVSWVGREEGAVVNALVRVKVLCGSPQPFHLTWASSPNPDLCVPV